MSNETQQETWNATHAQLLKSVADAQARLLAGINALEDQQKTAELRYFSICTMMEKDRIAINGRLDAIGAVLAELLTVRRPAKRGKTLNPKTLGYRSGQMIDEIFGKRRPAKRKR